MIVDNKDLNLRGKYKSPEYQFIAIIKEINNNQKEYGKFFIRQAI